MEKKANVNPFAFAARDEAIHDQKFDTKPIGYFKDVWIRFCRNKSSVVAAIIILILVLYAIFVPIFCETTYSRALTDTMYLHYSKLPPKIKWLGIDGTSKLTINSSVYLNYKAMGEETGLDPIVEIYREDYRGSDRQQEIALLRRQAGQLLQDRYALSDADARRIRGSPGVAG